MNMLIPYRFSELNVNNIIYTKIKKNKNKKIIYIKYKDKDKLTNFVFQTPSLLSIYKPELENNCYEINTSLIFKDEEKGSKFIDFLKELDEKILYDAGINSTDWFNNNPNVLYENIIKEDEYCDNGIINLKIIKTVDFETIIKLDNKKINIKDFKEDLICKMILECFAIIIIDDNTISLFLRPIVISLKNKVIEQYNYDFYDSDDSIDTKKLFIKNESNIIESENNSNNDSEKLSSTSSDN